MEEARAFSKIGHIGQLMLKAETDRELKAARKLANFKSNPGSAIGYYFPQQKDEWLIFEEATVFNRQKIFRSANKTLTKSNGLFAQGEFFTGRCKTKGMG